MKRATFAVVVLALVSLAGSVVAQRPAGQAPSGAPGVSSYFPERFD